ncbi:MAG: ABC transporter permease [Bacteroidia bacterium]|nr:ABC transporter permease [Bacteroidia bacterium]
MVSKLLYNFAIGINAIAQNKLRGFLTSLGIIFGVASVITMLAIGKGAKEEIMEQLKILGTHNIIIKPIDEQNEENIASEGDEKEEINRFSPGLSLKDANSILRVVPNVESVSPEIVLETNLIRSGIKRTGKLIGVNNTYFELGQFELEDGTLFTENHEENSDPVCIIGYGIKSRFFPKENPIGKQIKCGKLWLTVIGVMKDRKISGNNIKSLGLRDFNMDIYAPVKTVLLRFKDRARLTTHDIEEAAENAMFADEENPQPKQAVNYHQIDQLTVRIHESEYMIPTAEILTRMLERRHNNKVDFQIIVPEQLLKQKQETSDLFNNVLFSIAFISLLVGGIGIMNIMLASVLERIKEIGVRLAIGATKQDIILQFLSEAVAISITGGFIGVFMGILFSYLIENLTGITTIISGFSIVLSFFVAFTIGVIFGIFPARKAAKSDPVVSLRYE